MQETSDQLRGNLNGINSIGIQNYEQTAKSLNEIREKIIFCVDSINDMSVELRESETQNVEELDLDSDSIRSNSSIGSNDIEETDSIRPNSSND